MSIDLEYIEKEKDRENERKYWGDILAKLNEKKSHRELEREKKQRRRTSLEEQNENCIAVVRKWEMLATCKVKMSGGSKKNANTEEHKQRFVCEQIRLFLEKTYS